MTFFSLCLEAEGRKRWPLAVTTAAQRKAGQIASRGVKALPCSKTWTVTVSFM